MVGNSAVRNPEQSKQSGNWALKSRNSTNVSKYTASCSDSWYLSQANGPHPMMTAQGYLHHQHNVNVAPVNVMQAQDGVPQQQPHIQVLVPHNQ